MTWIIVGLGNPGTEYENTRHNAGRLAVLRYAKKNEAAEWREDKKADATVAKVGAATCVLPDTYMNKSGSAVAKYVKSAKAAGNMIVVYDDLDLPIGKMKISFDRGSGGHKGLDSVMRAVKTREFARIRIGVSPETPSGKMKKPHGDEAVNNFILGTFKPTEMDELKRIFNHASDAITAIIKDGILIAMNEFNSK